MNIIYLTSFIETVKQNSISKASKKLHLTQSALSQQLLALEKSLNVTLLARSNKGVLLTEDGEIVLNYAEAMVNLYQSMEKELTLSKKSLMHEIKIASCSTVGGYLLPCTLHLYKKNHSNIKFSLKSEHSSNVIEHILDYSTDVGFIDCGVHVPDIECFNISNSKLVFIYSNKKNIPGNSISINQIAEMPFIIGHSSSNIRKSVENIFINNNIELNKLNIEMELNTIESIKASVLANHGVSIVPYNSVKNELHTNVLKTMTITETPPSCNICMIYSKNKIIQPHIHEFIAYIKMHGQETFC